MTMKTELSEIERAAYEGALSRNRDPVVPGGSMVAGEEREVGTGAGEEEKATDVLWEGDYTGSIVLRRGARIRLCKGGMVFGRGVQSGSWHRLVGEAEIWATMFEARIRALEDERDALTTALEEHARRVRELEDALVHERLVSSLGLDEASLLRDRARLEEVRPVVRAAKDVSSHHQRRTLCDAYDALSSATQAWAEGSGEED